MYHIYVYRSIYVYIYVYKIAGLALENQVPHIQNDKKTRQFFIA